MIHNNTLELVVDDLARAEVISSINDGRCDGRSILKGGCLAANLVHLEQDVGGEQPATGRIVSPNETSK